MPNIWSLGRTGQVYGAAEASYGAAASLAATNAIRHQELSFHFSPYNPVPSKERHLTPGLRAQLKRRQTATWKLKGLMYPSGTLNTVPEMDVLLKNCLGAVANTTLAATVSASPAPTTTGATVDSATGLAAGQMINITTGGVTYQRYLTSVVSAALSWAPALPSAPSAGDAITGVVTYTPASALPASLDLAHYNTDRNREMLGCVADKAVFTLDASDEPMFEISGPAQGYAASAQSQPGSFTTVGDENGLPSGITAGGALYIGANALETLKVVVNIDNAMDLQNSSLGTQKPISYYRKGQRKITVDITTMVSDELTAWDVATAWSENPVFVQIGGTVGSIWGFYLPIVQFDVPDIPDNAETNQYTFKGVALETVGNDELAIGQG